MRIKSEHVCEGPEHVYSVSVTIINVALDLS